MLKNKTILEVKMGERIYSLECAPESPLGELHDVLCNMKGYVIQKMKDAADAQEAKSEQKQDCQVENICTQES